MASGGIGVQGNVQQSVFVTGDSNQVQLTFGEGGVELPLLRRHRPAPIRRRGPPRELDLLKPDAGKLPLLGRADELDRLLAWANDTADICVHGLIGRAGSGKTRLAIALCDRLDPQDGAPGAGAWNAGFVAAANLEQVVDTLATHRFDWPTPTLLVIDDAAAAARPLARWLDRLAADSFAGKLRVLLLEREAPKNFGWWHDLTDPATDSIADRGGLFLTPRPERVLELHAPLERRKLFLAARQAARTLRSLPLESHTAQAMPALDRALAAPDFGNPLALVMAGVIAADRPANEAPHVRRLDAARLLARREIERFGAVASSAGIAPATSSHILAFNILAGGLPLAELAQTLADELQAMVLSGDAGTIAGLLEQEWPANGLALADAPPRLGTIKPDLIAEGIVAETLLMGAGAKTLAAPAVAVRAISIGGGDSAATLIRLAQDYGYAAEDPATSEEERALATKVLQLLRHSTEALASENLGLLNDLVLAMPTDTIVLRELAAELTEMFVSAARARNEQHGDSDHKRNLAGLLHIFAIRLSAVGRPEEALGAAEEAVALYRLLDVARTDAFSPELAISLNNLAVRFSDLGRREDALAAAEEAVALFQSPSATRLSASHHHLASSHNNLANHLSALGRHKEALAAAEEAVRLRRTLVATRSDAFTPNLAGSLTNLASRLSSLGRREEALAAAEEAVELFRVLAAARPDAFTPDLATSLNNLAVNLSDLGQRQEALAAAEEAARLYRALVATQPAAFTPDLAASLNNLSNRLGNLDRHEEALAAAEEAVRLRRALVVTQPDAFTPNLAGSLHNLANRLVAIGQREEALAAIEEAVRLRRALVTARSDVFTPGLAMSLNNLANHLSLLDRREDALAAAEEAVTFYRTLAATRRDAFIPHLATSLSVYGNMLEKVDRIHEAVVQDREAVTLLSPYFLANPVAFAQHMAGSLTNYLRRMKIADVEVEVDFVFPIMELLTELHGREQEKST